MATKLINNKSYLQLRDLIIKEVQVGESNISQFVDFQRVVTNWSIGRLIDKYLLNNEHRSQYGAFLYEKLVQCHLFNTRTLNASARVHL